MPTSSLMSLLQNNPCLALFGIVGAIHESPAKYFYFPLTGDDVASVDNVLQIIENIE